MERTYAKGKIGYKQENIPTFDGKGELLIRAWALSVTEEATR